MEKLKGDSEENKRAFEEKLRQQEKERIKKEQKEKKEALKKARTQTQEDKKKREEKKQREEDKSSTQPTTQSTTTQPTTSKTSFNPKTDKKEEEPKIEKVYDECLIQIRMFNGSMLREKFPIDSSLFDVANFIQSKCIKEEAVNMKEFLIVTPFPKKEFNFSSFKSTSVKEAGLVPKGSITLQKVELKGKIIKGEGPPSIIDDPNHSDDEDYLPKPILPVEEEDTTMEERPIPLIQEGKEEERKEEERKIEKLICNVVWLFSSEESPEGTDILVYRPSTFEFESEIKNRPMMTFLEDGSISKVSMVEGVKTTALGQWKCKGTSLKITLEGKTKEYEIATITDEVLILS